MKKPIFLFIGVLLILSISIFKVRNNQVAIIKKYNGQITINYMGVHSFIPFLEKVYFIQLYKNFRVVEVPYTNNKESYLLKLLVEFKISDASNYFKSIDNNGKTMFLEQFDDRIKNILIKNLHRDINDLNSSRILFTNISLNDLGVFINSIVLYNIQYENAQYLLESLYNTSQKIKFSLTK